MPPATTHSHPSQEIVSQTVPDRINEDTWIAMPGGALGDQIVIAAIDGATTRLAPPPLQRYLDALPEPLTPAAYSARLVRDALIQQIAAGPLPDLRDLVLEANAALGRALTTILGDLTLEAMQFPPEIYDTVKHDPRLVRLGLPASVMTLAVYNPAEHVLHAVHAGDTLLLIANEDGRVEVPTSPGPGDADQALKNRLRAARETHPNASLRELTQSPDVRRFNLLGGLRHNFVDTHGTPQPDQGVGVLDGLPELSHYLQTTTIPLNGTAFVCVMTDGLEWPALAEELFTEDRAVAAEMQHARFTHMAHTIAEHGLPEYLRLLRTAEHNDADHERYPRMKTHDDATGVLLHFGTMNGSTPH